MMKRLAAGLKKTAAWMMSLFIVLSYFAVPVAALALSVDEFPALTLYYPEGDSTASVSVQASLYGDQPVYWAQVPAEALNSGVSLEIHATGREGETYNPPQETQLTVQDASDVDGSQAAVYIEVFRDGAFVGSAPLYVSTRQLPEEPVYFEPAGIEVRFLDQDGSELRSYSDSVGMEGKTFYAESIEGYDLTSAGEVTVTMDENGQLSQSTVEFWYARKSFPAQPVQIIFRDETGAELRSYADEVGMEGKTFYAESIEGYDLTSAGEVTVTMDENGQLSQSTVEFWYARKSFPAQPVQIIFRDESGAELRSYADEVGMEGKTFYAESIEGYELTSAGEVTVTMDENGQLSQSIVEFQYSQKAEPEPEPPKTASITMKVVDSGNAENVFYTHTAEYGEGTHTFMPTSEGLPEHYQLDSTDGVTVTVYADGTADTYAVVFTATYYAPAPEAPKTASITMKVVDSGNAENVFYTHTAEYGEGTHTFMPTSEGLPEHYQLDSTDGVAVTVYADGTADTYAVVFTATYHAPQQPEQPSSGLPEGVTLLETLDCEGETTKGSLRFRSAPNTDTDGNIVFSGIAKGVAVHVTSAVENTRGELWYGIIYEGQSCFVKGDCLKLLENSPAAFPAQPVNVYCYGDQGEELKSYTQDVGMDGWTFYAETIDGYDLTGTGEVTVTMDENGRLSQTTVEFHYSKKAAPEPEVPKTAAITMKVVDSANAGNVFYTHTAEYGEGTHTFMPTPEGLPEHYQLDSTDGATVTVYADGTADTYAVVFTATYHAPAPETPKTASITMKVVDSVNAESVFYTHTAEYGEGAHTFMPTAEGLPEHYQLDSTDGATVTVYADGTADTYTVVFTATYHAPQQPEQPSSGLPEGVTLLENLNCEGETTKGSLRFRSTPTTSTDSNIVFNGIAKGISVQVICSVENEKGELWYGIVYEGQSCYVKGDCLKLLDKLPVSFPVSFLYQDTDGNKLMDSVKEDFSEGQHSTEPYRKEAPEGYSYSGVSAETIVADANGANPAEVIFTYAAIPQEPVSAKVTFLYQDPEGKTLLDSHEETFIQGTHPVSYYQKEAPEGYSFQSVSHDQIVVDANGASPAVVVFTYKAEEKPPVTAKVTFEYRCEGQPIIEPVEKILEAGNYPASDYQLLFDGYTFTGASREMIVIEADGSTSDFSVTYDYNRNPVQADVKIYHRLADGTDVPGLTAETRTLEKNTCKAADFIRYAEGYSFLHASAETITVDENGANPAELILTYQKEKVQADITISLMDTGDAAIAQSYTITLGEGVHETAALKPAAPEGYAYERVSSERITVTSAGADPSAITFYYSKLPTEAKVSFRYVDEQGNDVNGLPAHSATLEAGTHDTAVYAATAPDGYLYSGASSAQIVIDENGANPAEVFFYYTRLPETVSIPVYHQNADGGQLMDPTVLAFDRADFGKTFRTQDVLPISAPEGYVYAGVSSDTITVDQRGGVTPGTLQVSYVVRPKAEADVVFHYVCDGKNIAESYTARLTEGSWDTNEYAAKVDGYTLIGADAQTVVIAENGTASPAQVTFTYEKLMTTANLTVYYRNSFGEELTGSPEIRALEKGVHTITPNAAYVPAGYVLSANTQSFEVTVNDDLTLSVPSVSFNYYDQNLTAAVTVNYYDTESGTTFATEQVKLAPGTHELKPNEALVKSKGNYEVSDILTNTTVKVDEKGAAVPTAVVFYYKPAAYQGYQGYLLVTQQTAIRKEAAAGGAVLALLEKDTVLWSGFQYQSGATEWFDAQTQTGDSYRGWVDGAHVRSITTEEAQILIEEASQPKEPDQNPGYYITIMNNVPLRQYKNTASQAKYLNVNTVVQVSGQEYDDAGEYLWHAATYYDYENKVKYAGFIRDGQLRKLTQEEEEEYLSANGPIDPDGSAGNSQYDPNGASSYGYVTKDSVNFRSEPGGTRIRMLNKYGMALITGTREVNGVTWYNVNYSGQVGWVHGDYFHQMTLSEFTSFMGSEAYYQGITNNTASSSGTSVSGGTKPSTGNTGSATQGNVSSVEDWNVGVWQNTGVTNSATYKPFNPYATPAATTKPKGTYTVTEPDIKFHQMASDTSNSVTLPKGAEITVAGTVVANGKTWYQVTYDGRNGYVEAGAATDKLGATPTPKPTSTFVIGTMIPITYDDQTTETQTGTVPWGLIGGAIALVGGAGGVYAYALNQNRKRKAAAARAAASRRKAAAAGTNAAGAVSPYARRAVAAPPVNQQRTQQPDTQSPYARPAQQTAGNQTQPAVQTRPAGRPMPVNQEKPANQMQGAFQPSPYARPQQSVNPGQPTGNPYARPVQAPAVNSPYAASAAEKENQPQQTANPYARPIAPVSRQTASRSTEEDGASAAPRRTRMQRYHDASGEGDSGTDA